MSAVNSHEFTTKLLSILGVEYKYVTKINISIEPFNVVRVNVEKLLTTEQSNELLKEIENVEFVNTTPKII